MKTVILFAFLLLSLTFAVSAQHEYAPLQEKEVKYKNWSYKSVTDGKEINLRDFTKDKKLVMVVYFAPWCPNWKLQAPVAQKFYEKYKASGLEIIGVGEYDTVDKMKASLETYKITFPSVFESDSLAARQSTPHYEYRQVAGDARKWGSPWTIFLTPSALKKQGDVLTEKAFVVNGELIEEEADKFIREKLGLSKEEQKSKDDKKLETAQNKAAEVCEPNTIVSFKKP